MAAPCRPSLIVAGLACLLAAVACQLPGAAATPAPSTAEPTAADEATLPPDQPTPDSSAATATALPADEPETFGPGAFDLDDPAAGLSSLTSYQATLTFAFNGTQAGQPVAWTRTYALLVSGAPAAARQVTIDVTGAEPQQRWLAEAGGVQYERLNAAGCTAVVVAPGGSLAEQWELARFLNAAIGAEPAGSETVNDVPAAHYTFDQRAFGSQAPVHTAVGAVWVAEDGGYVVRYTLTVTGGADYFGEGIDGTLTWDYALTAANQPVTITVPADCPPGLIAAPMLPDAAAVQNEPGLLSYTTASSVADTAAFYQAELPARGWQLPAEPTIKDIVAMLRFVQDAQQLTVLIANDGSSTSVQLVLGPVPPP